VSEAGANQSLTTAQIQALARSWLAEAIEEEDRILSAFRPDSPSDQQRAIRRAEKRLEGARDLAFDIHDIELLVDDATELLKQVGIDQPEVEAIDRLCDLLLRANVELQARTTAKLKGQIWKFAEDPVFHAPVAERLSGDVISSTPIRSIKELIEDYIDREIRLTTGPKNVAKASAHLRTFLEIAGQNRTVSSLNRNDLSDFRRVLETLPANVSKIFPGQSLREVASANHKRPALSRSGARSARAQCVISHSRP
jgi:hypothetical protein